VTPLRRIHLCAETVNEVVIIVKSTLDGVVYVCDEIRLYKYKMQPQQQQTVVVPTQPTYVHPPYTTSSVVNTYSSGQSAAVGTLLIIAGALSIIFNIVDVVVGSDDSPKNYDNYSYASHSMFLSAVSLGIVGHGLWSGAMVSIIFKLRQLLLNLEITDLSKFDHTKKIFDHALMFIKRRIYAESDVVRFIAEYGVL